MSVKATENIRYATTMKICSPSGTIVKMVGSMMNFPKSDFRYFPTKFWCNISVIFLLHRAGSNPNEAICSLACNTSHSDIYQEVLLVIDRIMTVYQDQRWCNNFVIFFCNKNITRKYYSRFRHFIICGITIHDMKLLDPTKNFGFLEGNTWI